MRAWTYAASSEQKHVAAGADTRTKARPPSVPGWVQIAWVHALSCAPLLYLLAAAALDRLGANPAEALVRGTGDWALRFLCLALAVTPMRHVLGRPAWARWRRPLGLYCFAYAVLHFLAYAWLDMGADLQALWSDVLKRPFIWMGVLSLLVLLPLALTSPKAVVRRLGGKRWQAVHRTVYLVPFLALTHFFWMRSGKNDYAEVAVYGAVLAVLLLWRLIRKMANPARPY